MSENIEKALRESEANLKAIIENSIESIWSIDTNYNIQYVNEVFASAFESSFGVTLKKGVNILASLPDALKPMWKERYDRACNNEHFVFLDKIDIVEPAIYIEVAMNPILVDGKVVGASFYGKDISKQKNYELQLIAAKEKAEESEITFKKLFEDSSDAILLIDKTGVFVECNQAALTLLKMTREQFLFKRPDFISPKYQSDGLDSFEKAHEIIKTAYEKGLQRFDWTHIDFTGNEFVVDVSLMPISIKGELMLHTTWRDITQRKKIEQELITAKENAVKSDLLKTAFLQNMSHEIRTPMNAIMGFSSLLCENFGDVLQLEKFSQIINQRCSDLLTIINDILDISKIESGQNPLHIEVCNLNELFSELAIFFSDYQNKTNKQHINLIINKIADKDIVQINTDILKLKQILINLITNSFKYSEAGHVACSCVLDNNQLLFSISDTGIGIPIDKHDYIFERFSQLKNSLFQNIGGTGLGLPIVKGLVELMGGKVWLKSECDKGTTFFFTIDYTKVIPTNKPSISEVNSSRDFVTDKTILIVEDDSYNALYLKEVLKNRFSKIFIAGNGLDAVNFIQNNSADIVLMDVQLPDISGYEATKMILQENPNIKIIAQTAYAANDERHKAHEAGCIDYISKPTKQNDLLNLLRKYL